MLLLMAADSDPFRPTRSFSRAGNAGKVHFWAYFRRLIQKARTDLVPNAVIPKDVIAEPTYVDPWNRNTKARWSELRGFIKRSKCMGLLF